MLIEIISKYGYFCFSHAAMSIGLQILLMDHDTHRAKLHVFCAQDSIRGGIDIHTTKMRPLRSMMMDTQLPSGE